MAGVQSDPLFLGLTRPAMIFGVTFPFAALNGLSCLMYFILASDFLGFVAMPFIHGIAYMICAKEPLAIELLMIKSAKCSKCRNKSFYGANSYDVY
ncbi:MAG: type IV secretion system protein VirB3 [Alphaproteobacteria bacterium]|jgi:type IV secretion system protein VirB3|nr:type IV secretion system protein VirB3 [Alphaproteobacteria bacterium]